MFKIKICYYDKIVLRELLMPSLTVFCVKLENKVINAKHQTHCVKQKGTLSTFVLAFSLETNFIAHRYVCKVL